MKRSILLAVGLLTACSSSSSVTTADCIAPDAQRLLTFCASPEAAAQAKDLHKTAQHQAAGHEVTPIPIGDAPILGPVDAPVTIVMFTDLECGFCARAHVELEAALKRHPDVRLVFKHMPLPFHDSAVPAAVGAMAAHEQGKFWEFVNLAYKNQQNIGVNALPDHAAALGLNLEQFGQDLGTDAHLEHIQADMDLGIALGVNGTPTMFINGEKVVGTQSADELDQLIARHKALIDHMQKAGVQHKDLYWRMVALNYEAPAMEDSEVTFETDYVEPEPRSQIQNIPILDSPVKGPDDAAVTLIVFSDFECPFCARINPMFDELQARWPGQIRIVFKHFPLDFHPNAKPAAQVALAAQKIGKFWEFHDLVFANQRNLDTETLVALGTQVGLSEVDVRVALTNQELADRVDADFQLGIAAGVRGTPITFLNGVTLSGASIEGWDDIIETQIEQANELRQQGITGEDLYQKLLELNGL